MRKFSKTVVILSWILFFSLNCTLLFSQPPCYSNYAISRAQIDAYQANFELRYKTTPDDLRTLKPYFDIDSCTILSYAAVFTSNSYDGFRIVFGTDEEDQNMEKLILVPTTEELTIGRKIYHKNDWTYPFPNLGCTAIVPDNSKKGALITQFEKHHRKNPLLGPAKRDSLSKAVWFPKCVMQFIADTIRKDPTKNLVGVRIWNIAYTQKNGVPGQKYGNQSTIAITFLSKEHNIIDVNWDINEKLYKEYLEYLKFLGAKKKKRFAEGLNHGELCPTSCTGN